MIAVAIDGPAGAGKSTIAKKAAEELGFIYVDTGAIYRAAALACIESHTAIDDAAAVEALLPQLDIRIIFFNGEQHILLNDKDVSESIRSENVSMAASRVSAIPAVRKFLLDLQRNFAKNADVIMDGRDIGTVVLPNAQVKIFLTASPEVRAQRRYKELIEKGMQANYEEVLDDIKERDYYDTHKPISPLRPAADSILIDTSEIDFEQSVQLVVDTINQKINA